MEKSAEQAKLVADKVIDHIRTMYPDALKAAPASAFTSLRNFTASAAQSAILSAVEEEREACAAIVDDMMLCTASDGQEVLLPRGSSGNKVGQAYASAIRNRKGA